MAAMYAVYHGPDGLTAIARHVHGLTRTLAGRLAALGVRQENAHYFDTLRVTLDAAQAVAVRRDSEAAGYNLRHVDDTAIGISLDETATMADVDALVQVFAAAVGKPAPAASAAADGDALPPALRRTSAFLAPSGVPSSSLRERDDALHEAARAQGHRPRRLDDPARLVHDEAERGQRDVPGELARVLAHASVRAGRPDRGLPGDLPRARSGAGRDHRLCRDLAAAQLRRAGRAGRPAGDPRLAPRARRGAPQRRADPGLGARHQPGQRGDGRVPRGGRGLGPGRQHQRRGSRRPRRRSTPPTWRR